MVYCDVIECKHNMSYGSNRICGNAFLRVAFDIGCDAPVCTSCEYITNFIEDEKLPETLTNLLKRCII